MSDREPCDHSESWAGRVQSGDLSRGRHCSVYTCERCVGSSREYVTAVTGLPASQLIPFRRRRP